MSPGMNDIGYGRTTSDSKFRKKRQEEKESKSTQGKKPDRFFSLRRNWRSEG